MVEKDEKYFIGNSPQEDEKYFIESGLSSEGQEKRSKLKSNLIKAGAVGVGVIALSGAANAASLLYRDEAGTLTPIVNEATDKNEKVKYDASDPTAGYVADKIIAGTGISVAEGTGADENKLVVTNTDKGSDVDLGANNLDTNWTYANVIWSDRNRGYGTMYCIDGNIVIGYLIGYSC